VQRLDVWGRHTVPVRTNHGVFLTQLRCLPCTPIYSHDTCMICLPIDAGASVLLCWQAAGVPQLVKQLLDFGGGKF
jgi:hypothetical protein